MTMVATGGQNGSEQRPNLWEELNRPRRDRAPEPSPPIPMPPPESPPPSSPQASPAQASGAQSPPPTGQRPGTADEVEGDAGIGDDGAPPPAPPSAAVAMKRIDSQHLLLVGGLMFVVVAFVGLRGLGDSSDFSSSSEEATRSTAAPERLPSLDQSTTTLASATPSTTAGPTAMGLPAELLDGPQSSVYRLYRTALGREPDRSGFQYWADQVRAGTPLDTLARQFLASEEFVGQFAGAASTDERTVLLIRNAFGPTDDDQQMRLWLERYRGLEGAALLLAISEADETLAFTGTLR